MRAAIRSKVPPRAFTTREIADAWNVHPVTIRRWYRAGILVGRKAGPRNHKLWFADADLDAFLRGTPQTFRHSLHALTGNLRSR